MVRAFRPEPVAPAVLDGVLDAARRAPSAGFAQGVDLVVLEGADTARYWDTSLPGPRREGFPWPGLLAAPVLVVVAADPRAYVTRYSEPDKARTGLGTGSEAWPQPMWFVDAGMAAMALLLAAVDAGLGACFFGVFEHEAALCDALGVPEPVRLAGTVALGHADPEADRRSRSAGRARRPAADQVHRGGW